MTAVLRGGAHDGTGPVVLLRGDMDALPVTEETGLTTPPSTTGRCMPAATTCTSRRWSAPRGCCTSGATSCAGDVVLMWQPAEETTAGARR